MEEKELTITVRAKQKVVEGETWERVTYVTPLFGGWLFEDSPIIDENSVRLIPDDKGKFCKDFGEIIQGYIKDMSYHYNPKNCEVDESDIPKSKHIECYRVKIDVTSIWVDNERE